MAMLDLERVKETFGLYSGEDLGGEDARAALCIRLCEECAAKVEALADAEKAGENGGAFLPALESWAAAQAFYQLTLADEALCPESVSAEGVSVRPGERWKKALALAEEKRRAALPALRGEEFYFGRA